MLIGECRTGGASKLNAPGSLKSLSVCAVATDVVIALAPTNDNAAINPTRSVARAVETR